jgi:hypothetical protein
LLLEDKDQVLDINSSEGERKRMKERGRKKEREERKERII